MIEGWVKDARNKARVEANLYVETNRVLGAAEQMNQELKAKLTMEEKAQRSAEADLKNV